MPDLPAVWSKRYDTWQPVTWAEYWDAAHTVANGLLALGVGVGDRVAIHAGNRPEWLFADVATMAVRGTSVGVYPTSPPAEVGHVLGHSAAKVLIVEGRPQLETALSVLDAAPGLAWIVHLDPAAAKGREDHPKLISWADLLTLGAEHARQHPNAVRRAMSHTLGDDVITVVYTSGTTGPARGAMLSVSNVEFLVDTLMNGGGFTPPAPGPDDVLLSYLPLCNVAERISSTWLGAGSGLQVYFAESPVSVAADLREVRPTILLGVPRLWEKLGVGLVAAARRPALRAALVVSRRVGISLARRGGRASPVTRAGSRLAARLGVTGLRAAFGLDRVRYAASGAAPIAPELLTFFMGLGIPVHEVYGQTENGAIATVNMPGRIRIGTVGEPQRGVEVAVDRGEVLVRHPGVFVGYLNDPEATARAKDSDGWLRTGDAGEWVDGNHLRLTGRIKDILITSGGVNVAPGPIENALKASPYVAEALVVGDGRPYLTALIGPDRVSVAGLDEEAVRRLIRSTVDHVNAGLSRPAQIKDFRLLPRDLSPLRGELTATLKVRRSVVMSVFADLVGEMYPERPI